MNEICLVAAEQQKMSFTPFAYYYPYSKNSNGYVCYIILVVTRFWVVTYF